MNAHKILNWCIAIVWLSFGLFCKVLNLEPRHQEIVGRIIGIQYAHIVTIIIGLAETMMAVWIISGILPGLNAILQMVIIAIMNALEFFLAPDLLLWGRFNALFAFLFIALIFYNEFYLRRKINRTK